jgi:hypothetical protein
MKELPSTSNMYRLTWWKKIPRFLPFLLALPFHFPLAQKLGLALYDIAVVAILFLAMVAFEIVDFSQSYFALTADGIEWRYWPFVRFVAHWEDVESIQHSSSFPFRSDYLVLRKANRIGRRITGTIENVHVNLADFAGWPNGTLAEVMLQYAPHLFDTVSRDE